MTTLISEIPPASAKEALDHFSRRLRFETDCSDVYVSQQAGNLDYVLVDVRNQSAFEQSHISGSINIPVRTITQHRLSEYSTETLFVIYCAGPHCNGVHRAAVRFAQLGYCVKEMIGGITGWIDEGLPLNRKDEMTTESGFSCGC